MSYSDLPGWLQELIPIGVLLAVIAFVIARLPRVEVGHSDAYRFRRLRNWLPVGLLYAFLYMGRYNLTVAFASRSAADFGIVFWIGTWVYGCSFLVNGPLTDRIGGKRAILIGAAGAAIANILLGVAARKGVEDVRTVFSVLYGANMYFQSFGAVAIVKINAPWFHVRERGVFGAIFGILISLGIYFAFDWGKLIHDNLPAGWVFFIPGALLILFFLIVLATVKNTPGEAGFDDFDTADASSGDEGPQLGAVKVFKMMLTNPIIMTIACIEFFSGFLRQAIMQWYRRFVEATTVAPGEDESAEVYMGFVYENWGLLLCCAGMLGGVFAGTISDHVFQSRRGPVAAILYSVMLAGAVMLVFALGGPLVGLLVLLMSMAVIGVHGMLSGTASMDFGGRRNVGVAVGIIDGFVYVGTGVMSLTYALLLPDPEGEGAGQIENWNPWPIAMVPAAALGLLLATRIWHAKPKPRSEAKA
ncbi:MAG: MFS transporter [Planctomycetota bacterium]|nr:MFS transporter [Planctomycetota bacterium]